MPIGFKKKALQNKRKVHQKRNKTAQIDLSLNMYQLQHCNDLATESHKTSIVRTCA